MGQFVSMFSSFNGDKWDFSRVFAHSRLRGDELKNSHEYLIDVRESSEIASSGSIPNALNIPLGSLEGALKFPKTFESFSGSLPRSFPDAEEDQLIFTCQSGMRAGRAAIAAQALGYERVALYSGSFSDWSSKIKGK